MASIQNPYYVSGSGRSYGDGIASIAQALLSGPTPDQIAANESDMRYRDALGGKALAETDLLTDKRKALGGLGAVVQQLMSGDPNALAGLAQTLGQGDGLGEFGNLARAVIANMPGATDGQIGKAMAGAGTPLADNEALTPEAQAEKLRLAEEAAFGRIKYTADSSASASRYGSDRQLEGTLGAARIGEDGALARVREQGFIDARKPLVLKGGETAVFNDPPAFGGAGTRQNYTARDLGAEGTLAGKLAEIAAESAAPVALNADQTLVTPAGGKLVTAPSTLKAAVGEVVQGADGTRLEGRVDPTGNNGKDPLDISPDETAKLGFALDDLATAAGGVLDGATKARLTERAAQLYQQTRNAGTATAQAWREIMGQEPVVEGVGNPFVTNRVIPGTSPADTAQYDGQQPAAAPPPMEARVKNQVYQTPKGPMMWTGTGWKPAT